MSAADWPSMAARCDHPPAEPPDEPIAPGDEHYYDPGAFCRGGCGRALTLGDPWRTDAAGEES